MKVEVTVPSEKPRVVEKYPCLKVRGSGQQLVLFLSPGTGVVLRASLSINSSLSGFFSEAWVEDNFRPFEGSVTLSND